MPAVTAFLLVSPSVLAAAPAVAVTIEEDKQPLV